MSYVLVFLPFICFSALDRMMWKQSIRLYAAVAGSFRLPKTLKCGESNMDTKSCGLPGSGPWKIWLLRWDATRPLSTFLILRWGGGLVKGVCFNWPQHPCMVREIVDTNEGKIAFSMSCFFFGDSVWRTLFFVVGLLVLGFLLVALILLQLTQNVFHVFQRYQKDIGMVKGIISCAWEKLPDTEDLDGFHELGTYWLTVLLQQIGATQQRRCTYENVTKWLRERYIFTFHTLTIHGRLILEFV